MIHVFGASVQQADAHARAEQLSGARSYGPDSRLVGLLFYAGDEVHLLAGVSEQTRTEVNRVIVKSPARPTVRTYPS